MAASRNVVPLEEVGAHGIKKRFPCSGTLLYGLGVLADICACAQILQP